MYTHTQCPICTANGVKDEHDLQIFRARDLYEEPFLMGLGLYEEKERKLGNPARAYCGYHNDFVSDWYAVSADALSNLYPKEPFKPIDFGNYQASISSRLNIPNLCLEFQTDFGFNPTGVLFVKATFVVRSQSVQRYGYYIVYMEKGSEKVSLINCQEINTGKIKKTTVPIRWDYDSRIIQMIVSDFAQWQILEGQ